jgi:hypothetical protein
MSRSSTWLEFNEKERIKDEELRWWREVYLAALQGGNILVAAEEIADEAVVRMRERRQRLNEEENNDEQ